LDQERFFVDSRFGKAALERERAAIFALEAENARIEQELIAEEQSLTEQRKTLPADEFAALAQAFDIKVEGIRAAQDAKARDLTQQREAERQRFLQVAVPVLGTLMEEKGAVMVLDKSAIILSLTEIDITDEAIARVDQAAPGADLPPASP
jgi:Skp family chaperone for outer membrane proteins